jgi:hypothetical protein
VPDLQGCSCSSAPQYICFTLCNFWLPQCSLFLRGPLDAGLWLPPHLKGLDMRLVTQQHEGYWRHNRHRFFCRDGTTSARRPSSCAGPSGSMSTRRSGRRIRQETSSQGYAVCGCCPCRKESNQVCAILQEDKHMPYESVRHCKRAAVLCLHKPSNMQTAGFLLLRRVFHL